jgi:hypothetical protein
VGFSRLLHESGGTQHRRIFPRDGEPLLESPGPLSLLATLGCSRIHKPRGRSLALIEIEAKSMKKQIKKLVLAKETLANLKKLDGVQGGGGVPNTDQISACPAYPCPEQ